MNRFLISPEVTKVPLVNQCAEIQRIAFGVGIFLKFPKPLTNWFSSIAFIGEPCPKKELAFFPFSEKHQKYFVID
jgi:hypothetical protein